MQDENKYPAIFATPANGYNYTVNVSQVFGDAYTFDEVIHILSIATPDDHITFNINSDGGNLYSLIALRNAIRATQANIHMNLLGMAASAGGALFLEAAHSYRVHDNSCLMIHNMICGTGYDDTHKIMTRAEHNKRLNDRFVRETYEDFLSEEEIEKILDGKEIYLEDFEIRERLIARENIRNNRRLDEVNKPADLSDYTTEELEAELGLYQEDIKMIRTELKKRLK
ncbi:ATP-dependent Clp protease proteolytic subunit [Acinetobacter phage BS46]|nr:ATP-dependent Clp protease proteolytic subunit [Acinetobacter phage BS46]